jgi:hypothetical protein
MDEKRYQEIGTNYRYFLSWRHAAFAGDLIILYGVFSLTSSIYNQMSGVAWLVPLIASPIGILLLMIDIRTRDLYHAAIRAGIELEGNKGGFFTQLSKEVLPIGASPFQKVTQTGALYLLFIGSSVILFSISVSLFILNCLEISLN